MAYRRKTRVAKRTRRRATGRRLSTSQRASDIANRRRGHRAARGGRSAGGRGGTWGQVMPGLRQRAERQAATRQRYRWAPANSSISTGPMQGPGARGRAYGSNYTPAMRMRIGLTGMSSRRRRR